MTDRERAYIVIALVERTGKKHEGCRVIPHGELFPAIYSQVFGPASQRDCEKWMNSNCGRPVKAK
ncbi:MAG TPA: hypothetical protein VFX96_13725 [Pyrinomonadaceae bacterium]|nr:hypothetical protein [Pyrinomonadaceae bacterium]